MPTCYCRSRPSTFKPVDYEVPQSVEEARGAILKLSQRLAKGEIAVEMHDALVNDLRVYLADKALDQQRELDRLKSDLGMDERP
jgi:hypothetical protein